MTGHKVRSKSGFCLENIGLLSANWPRVSGIILIVLLSFSIIGVTKVRQDDRISNLFRSEQFEFKKFQNMRDLFRESENDVAIILEAPDVLTRENLVAAHNIYLDIFLEDGVAAVFSAFTVREAPDRDGNSAPIFPDPIPEGDQYDALRAQIEAHPLIMGRTISLDKRYLLIVAALDSGMDDALSELVGRIEQAALDIANPLGIKVHLAGVPVLRNHVKSALSYDWIVFNVFGFGLGALICLLFMRSLTYAALASIPPIFAVVFSVGIMGWSGIPLNTLSNVLPALVLVLAFADSMHMAFAVRDGLNHGMSGPMAANYAVRKVGPACVLTSMTTAIALVAITLTSSDQITSFGWITALGAVIAFFSVITIVPTISALFASQRKKGTASHAPLVRGLSHYCTNIAEKIANQPKTFALTGLGVLIVGVIATLQLQPRYQISVYLPNDPALLAGTRIMDEQFGGAVDILVVVRWQDDSPEALPHVLAAIGDVHNAVESHPLINNTWSIESLRLWLTDSASEGGIDRLAGFILQLPAHWLDRLLAPSANAALVAGRVPDLESADIRVLADDLERMTGEAIAEYPGMSVEITGISELTARESAPMIRQLAFSVLSAVVMVGAMIAFSFRSLRAAAFSLIPNLIPLSLGGALLYAMDRGLTYESTLALTLAFGIAVDDTIHFLYHLGRGGWQNASEPMNVIKTMREVGPILIITTIVLGVGFVVTLFSVLPSIWGFGAITIMVIMFALLAVLLILPAILMMTCHECVVYAGKISKPNNA